MKQEAIIKAIEETRFDKLKSQELKAGFKERNKTGNNYFRSVSEVIGQKN